MTLAVEAKSFAFAPASLAAPAGAPLSIDFRNADTGVPHNVVVRRSTGEQVFSGAIITGVSRTTYRVPALGAGTYALACVVHPEMSGTITVR